MLNIYLLRHGETSYNADGNRYCGRTDIGLTPKGRQQAETVRQQLKDFKFDAVYSSPLERAYYTACIASGSDRVIKDARLIELDFGLWEGKTKEEFIAEDPAVWEEWVANPGISRAGRTGEHAGGVITRVAIQFSRCNNTFILLIAGREIVFTAFNATCQGNLIAVLGTCTESFFLPVSIRIAMFIT